jgi:hypothetical protein
VNSAFKEFVQINGAINLLIYFDSCQSSQRLKRIRNFGRQMTHIRLFLHDTVAKPDVTCGSEGCLLRQRDWKRRAVGQMRFLRSSLRRENHQGQIHKTSSKKRKPEGKLPVVRPKKS